MNSQLSILAVCNYPTDLRPAHQVFVRALLLELKALGAEVTVVAPESLAYLAKSGSQHRLAPRHEVRDGIPVHRPRYPTFSKIALPGAGTTERWNDLTHAAAALREAKKLQGPFDVCYAHFLYPHGLAAARVGGHLGIPTVVALGESSFGRYSPTYTDRETGRLLSGFSGIIANSHLIREYCVEHFDVPPGKITVFPNGVNEESFYPRDREWARKRCNLPQDRPIAIFVGQFIERKGPLRVLEAVRDMPEVGVVFLGQGPQVPAGPQVLYQGSVPHEEVPIWLSAADLFVLPTLDEGCSNAILEALSCGLPVVSSDLPFNYAILDDQSAVMVDPRDVGAIGAAIAELVRNPERRAAMQEAALQRSRSFRLGDRAQGIIHLLSTVVSQPAAS
jgi:teichuronic acid biosynthesis glycosyltransferase TuaC